MQGCFPCGRAGTEEFGQCPALLVLYFLWAKGKKLLVFLGLEARYDRYDLPLVANPRITTRLH